MYNNSKVQYQQKNKKDKYLQNNQDNYSQLDKMCNSSSNIYQNDKAVNPMYGLYNDAVLFKPKESSVNMYRILNYVSK